MNVPASNEEVFRLLYKIENGLRELIVETLERIDGPRWYRTRLPAAVLGKFREGIAAERSVSWSRLIPHHPIYYIDFPHLREIITNGKNWDPVFKQIFVRREIFEGNFAELEAIRNRVAHNRKLSEADVEIARGIHRVFAELMGPEEMESLAGRCTSKDDIAVELATLRQEAERSYSEISSLKPISGLTTWNRVSNAWWFDDDYLVTNLDGIRRFFQLSEAYSQLPRRRGTGPEIEKWVQTSSIDKAYADVCDQTSRLSS